ncbi:MAG: condensation domain-containing protein, partial [Candidatus Xenobia bacterium]
MSEKRALLQRLLRNPNWGPTVVSQGFTILHQQALPQLAIHNLRMALELDRHGDPALLRTRLQHVVNRHSVLRSVYRVAENQLVFQEVREHHDVALEAVDVRGWTAEQRHARMVEDAGKPFDVFNLPVFRAWLYQGDAHDSLLISAHHAASDLWTLEIILSELLEPPGGPPPPPFVQYAKQQLAWLTGPRGAAASQFWRDTCQGATPLTFRPSRFLTPAGHLPFWIHGERFQRVRRVLQASRVTLFTFMLSAVQAALRDTVGQEDVLVVAPTANRDDPGFAHT